MCMIAVKSKNVGLPKKEHLKNGAEKNKDGMGIGYWKKGENVVHIKKDFKDFEELWNFIESNIAKEDALIVHFRKSTGGKTDAGASHPYPVTTKRRFIRKPVLETDLIMAHNGIISGYNDTSGIYSDTQLFILNLLAKPIIRDNIDNAYIMELIEMAVSPSRLVFLNKEGTSILLGDWEKEEKIYFSNKQYKSSPLTVYGQRKLVGFGYGYYGFNDNDDWWNKKKSNSFNTRKSGGVYTQCDGCGAFKEALTIKYKKRYLVLCKDCRRLLSTKGAKLPDNLILVERGFYFYQLNKLAYYDKKKLIDFDLYPKDVTILADGKLIITNEEKRREIEENTCFMCGVKLNENERNIVEGTLLCENCARVFERNVA